MNKRIVTALAFLCSASFTSAQTLFTYGNESVTAPEFLKAYQKNNASAKSPAAMQNYLDLYIASRLKIKEAKARGYDTLFQLNADLENLRQQVLPGYLLDEESSKALTKEAFDRSQKDVHVAHLFMAFANGDTVSAYKKAQQAYQLLKTGKSFADIAKQYSDDPSATSNGGDMGYVTVFSLPYELENIVYATPVGIVSGIYKSRIGYHIFKKVAERKALGRLRAAQILLALPPEADAAAKASVKKLADSLYNRLQKGDDFGKLATAFSADPISAASQGQVPPIGVGQFDPTFESVAFALPKDGAFSKPFQSAHGWHIVKRLSLEPVPADFNSAQVQDELPEKVKASDRIQVIDAAVIKKVMQQFKPATFGTAALWAYSDSLLNSKPANASVGLQSQTPLFSLGEEAATVDNWIQFAQLNRFKRDGSGLKAYPQLWEEFIAATAMEYYKTHLEQFNPAFKAQMEEFKEGNLFFEIMQREIWNPAQNDTAALLNYYNQNKANYQWKGSADAVIFYANDIPTAQLFFKDLSKTPAHWRAVVARYNDQVVPDSNRFEIAQLPGAPKNIKAGTITPLVSSKEDNSASFAYILKAYTKPEQRSFEQAKGLVINDYQAELEKRWVEALRKKYPVVVDQNVLNELLQK